MPGTSWIGLLEAIHESDCKAQGRSLPKCSQCEAGPGCSRNEAQLLRISAPSHPDQLCHLIPYSFQSLSHNLDFKDGALNKNKCLIPCPIPSLLIAGR